MSEQFLRKPYLWELEHRQDYDESQESFIQTVMQENLNHARHVENERMSLLVGIAALVAGVLAVGGGMLTTALQEASERDILVSVLEFATILLILGVTLLVLLLCKRLNTRWNMTFDRHMFYARSCYYLLHRSNFELNDRGLKDDPHLMPEDLTEAPTDDEKVKHDVTEKAFQEDFKLKAGGSSVVLETMPLYCFSINKRVDRHNVVDTRNTKKYFDIFYNVLLGILLLLMAIDVGVAVVCAAGLR
ncbi:MAG: hypothetical protein IKH56_10205 [Oscillospiraceae bacterium]|nr:hypothetical protein [Oscillospiraceae bacterium]